MDLVSFGLEVVSCSRVEETDASEVDEHEDADIPVDGNENNNHVVKDVPIRGKSVNHRPPVHCFVDHVWRVEL